MFFKDRPKIILIKTLDFQNDREILSNIDFFIDQVKNRFHSIQSILSSVVYLTRFVLFCIFEERKIQTEGRLLPSFFLLLVFAALSTQTRDTPQGAIFCVSFFLSFSFFLHFVHIFSNYFAHLWGPCFRVLLVACLRPFILVPVWQREGIIPFLPFDFRLIGRPYVSVCHNRRTTRDLSSFKVAKFRKTHQIVELMTLEIVREFDYFLQKGSDLAGWILSMLLHVTI